VTPAARDTTPPAASAKSAPPPASAPAGAKVAEKPAPAAPPEQPAKREAAHDEPGTGPESAGKPVANAKSEPTTHSPDVAVDPNKMKVSTEAEREALAELIKAAAIQAQKEMAEHPAPPALASPSAPPSTAPTTLPAVATSENPAAGPPRMELSPTEFNFNEVWQGAPAEGEFKIKNVGTGPLTLNTTSSCGCTVATKPKSPLEPGETTSFKISYNTSHTGNAQKTVTITTNDPQQPAVAIKVSGTVKPLVAATPADRISFSDLEVDSVQSQTIKLESKYDTPLNLKLRENQDFGPFTVEFKEVEPGKLYELTATTKPPLPTPVGTATVLLETGLEKVPAVSIQLNASVPPRVAVMPPQLVVAPTATQPTQQIVQLQCRGATPVEIKEVRAGNDSVKWEVLPPDASAAGAKMRVQRVRVTLPPYSDLPDAGTSLQIVTSDPEERYQKLDVRIIKVRAPAAARPSTASRRSP
jgi:hypothetical protein